MKDINLTKSKKMKNIKILTLLFVSLLVFNSCIDDDSSITYVVEPTGEFQFSNTLLTEYVLIPSASGNLGERFTWDNADFGVETNITYELQKSIIGDFSDMEVIGTTVENSYDLTIGDLLGFAGEAGLDNDPVTTEVPNTGNISFRLRAFVGTDSSIELISSPSVLTLVLPEDTGSGGFVCDLDQLWAVGAGLPDAGWGWTTPESFPCNGNGIYSWNVNLLSGEAFRFFTSEGDWSSGQNYPFFADAGYTIDMNFEDAMDGDNNFRFIGDTGYYYLEVNTVDLTITLDSPQPTGVCEFDQLWGVGAGLPDAGWGWTTPERFLCTGEGVYSGSANLLNGEAFRFFTSEGDWATGQNYPFFADAGYTIDVNFEDAMDGDNNFRFIGTTGNYEIIIDTVALTITLN